MSGKEIRQVSLLRDPPTRGVGVLIASVNSTGCAGIDGAALATIRINIVNATKTTIAPKAFRTSRNRSVPPSVLFSSDGSKKGEETADHLPPRNCAGQLPLSAEPRRRVSTSFADEG
jgi:hypothetical protein